MSVNIIFFLFTSWHVKHLHLINFHFLKFFFSIGKHSLNLSTQKNGEIIGEYNHEYHINNCSSLVKQQSPSSRNSNMNSNCCYDVPARVVLYFLSWSGFLVSFMMRNDVNILIKYRCVCVCISLHKVLLLDKFCYCCHDKIK